MIKQARTFTEEAVWRAYEDRLRAHNWRMEARKPKRDDFVNETEYEAAHSKWVWESAIEAPMEPEFETV